MLLITHLPRQPQSLTGNTGENETWSTIKDEATQQNKKCLLPISHKAGFHVLPLLLPTQMPFTALPGILFAFSHIVRENEVRKNQKLITATWNSLQIRITAFFMLYSDKILWVKIGSVMTDIFQSRRNYIRQYYVKNNWSSLPAVLSFAHLLSWGKSFES